MDPSAFAGAAQLASHYGYALMFLLMLVEGPVVTAAGAFLAALGTFNLWLVLLLSVLGNLIPDAIYYAAGFWGRQGIIDKYGHYWKITPERVKRLEELYHEHAGKTLMALKLIPVLATPGLIIAGIAKVPLKKFAWWSLIVTVPSSFGYLLIGYYFGAAYHNIIRYVDYGGYLLATVFIILILISYFGGKKVSRKISKRIEKV